MKNTIFLTIAFSLLTVTSLWAQEAPPASTPISGLELALAGGVAYGVKKLYGRRKKNQ